MRIVGTKNDDVLMGGPGDDILDGRAGADRLLGGDGRDTAVYLSSAAGVHILLSSHGLQSGGDALGDILDGVENATGSQHNDWLIGDAANNVLRGAGGADIIDGGDGNDRASYAYSSSEVDIDLTRSGPQTGGDANGDILVSIENVTGSDHDDRIVGNGVNNLLAGGAGADFIDGGGGSDTVDYRGSSAVDVDLTRATQLGGHAQGDALMHIENITGSAADDRILGDAARNYLSGDAGDDYIDGRGGFDDINGGAGNDTIIARHGTSAIGGDGDDTLVLRLDDEFAAPAYSIVNRGYALTADYGDWDNYFERDEGIIAYGFERVEIHAGNNDDFLTGLPGDDVIYGNGDNDTIVATSGRDYLDGGDGWDVVRINYGNTTRDISVDLANGKVYGYAGVVKFEFHAITTGSGNDVVIGAAGSDNPVLLAHSVATGAGNDLVDFSHSTGANFADLGTGYDRFIGGAGSDHAILSDDGDVDGGAGDDDQLTVYLSIDAPMDIDVMTGMIGDNISFRNVEHFRIEPKSSGDHGDVIRLGAGNDYVFDYGGNNVLVGRDGNDHLQTGNGNDHLDGGAGDDTLLAGGGDDVLTGGSGADRFHFQGGYTVITDFDAAEGDRIVVQRYLPNPVNSGAEVLAHSVDTEDGVVITLTPFQSMLLEGVALSALEAEHFVV